MHAEPRSAVLTKPASPRWQERDVPNPTFVVGWRRNALTALIGAHILWIAFCFYRNPRAAIAALWAIRSERRRLQGGRPIPKFVRVDGRYFFLPGVPGWPSRSFRTFVETELQRIRPRDSTHAGVQNVVLSVTGRCPLACEHCCAWGERENCDDLSVGQLERIVNEFGSKGAAIFQLSGGEPVGRVDDVIELLESTASEIEFWMFTSGHGLTGETASRLKQAGLTGVCISLDSWNESDHNAFRGRADAFQWARQAARDCARAGLVVCFMICVSRSFAKRENLWRYLRLVASWGAHFVRIIEPKAVGRYADQDVELREEQLSLLSDFHQEANGQAGEHLPVVVCPSMRQRVVECIGSGNRSVYVDSRGDLHNCPFCLHSFGNALVDSFDSMLTAMRAQGCPRDGTRAAPGSNTAPVVTADGTAPHL